MRIRPVSVAFVIATLLVPSAAGADGWKIQLQGVRALGTAYAGRSAVADDASAVWFNPAAMTQLAGEWTVTAGAPIITYQLRYRDAGSSSVLGQPLPRAESNGGRTAAVPHVYVVRRLSDRWRAGFGFNAPFGLGTDYGEGWTGRYHATETTLTVFNVNPSAAIRVSEGVAVGFGFDLQRSAATLANMIDFGSIGAAFGLPLTPEGQDGSVRFTGGDWGAGFNLGATIDAGRRTRFGVAYRSEIEHQLEGDADFFVPAPAAALTGAGTVFVDTSARTTLPMPHEISISAAHELSDRWTLLSDVTWTDWSAFREFSVAFDNPSQPTLRQDASWKDSMRVAGGLRVRAGERLSFRGGAAYETVPVPDATRTPRLPERPHTWLAGSVMFGGRRWQWDAHVTHLITADAPIAITDPGAGTLTGSVHWRLTIAGISATMRF